MCLKVRIRFYASIFILRYISDVTLYLDIFRDIRDRFKHDHYIVNVAESNDVYDL